MKKRYSAAFKAEVLLELLKEDKAISKIALTGNSWKKQK
jgi:transposase-like protein